MSYDEDWGYAVAGPLTAIRNREVAYHDLDPKTVHTEAQRLLTRIGLDMHHKYARAVMIEMLMQWQPSDSDDSIPEDK